MLPKTLVRSALISSCLLASLLAAAAPPVANVEAPPPPPAVVPAGAVDPASATVRIVSARRPPRATLSPAIPGQPASGAAAAAALDLYRGGPIPIEVEVENRGDSAAPVTLRITRSTPSGAKTDTRTATVPPKGRTFVPYVVDDGVPSACHGRLLTVSLAGVEVETKPKVVHVTPSCSLKSVVEDSWTSMTPDRVADAQQGRVYASAVTLEKQPTCSEGTLLAVTVLNRSPSAAAGVEVAVVPPEGAWVGPSKTADVDKGASKTVKIPVATLGRTGFYRVGLDAKDPALKGKLANRSVGFRVTRACTIGVSLEPYPGS